MVYKKRQTPTAYFSINLPSCLLKFPICLLEYRITWEPPKSLFIFHLTAQAVARNKITIINSTKIMQNICIKNIHYNFYYNII